MGRLISRLLFVLLAAAVALGFWNVMGDSAPVEALARATACAGQGARCAARLEGAYVKTPFFHDLELRTSPRRLVDVRCARAYVFVGDYGCRLKS
jgi:hypothetical protein